MEPPEKKTRRRYSDREIAGALAIYDRTDNLTETSRLTGIPDSTISGWVTAGRQATNPDIPLMRAGYDTTGLADSFEEAAHRSMGEVNSRLRDQKQVKDIPFTQLLRASEVGAEKSQLLRGLPTSIVEERVDPRRVLILMGNALGIEGIEPPIETEGRVIEGT